MKFSGPIYPVSMVPALLISMVIGACWLFPARLWAETAEPSSAAADPAQVQERAVLPTTPQREPPPPPNPRFQVVLGGFGVLDKETLLVWQRQVMAASVTADNAAATCRHDRGASRLGWRLATGAELGSLLDLTRNSPALPIGHPFSLPSSALQVWTADRYQLLKSNSAGWEENTIGYIVSLKDGRESEYYLQTRGASPNGTPMKAAVNNPTLTAAVWCVRGPVLGPLQ
jgi:hypothetical protein